MFIGDGINDSPVLAQADIGCAINSASDITVSAAGIVLIKDDLIDVLRAILISKKSFQRIKINFAFAFLYNVILIPVAMGVFYPIHGFKLDPMFAAVAMAMSSISVVSSSLFLKLYNPNDHIRDSHGGSVIFNNNNKVKVTVEDSGESVVPLVQDEAV
jgi:Cu+-exporting ATPase